MIPPTIGRVVWFTPSVNDETRFDVKQPLAAFVTYVWHDRLVNLTVFSQDGTTPPAQKTSVTLLQDDDLKPETGYFASWMPYQNIRAKQENSHETEAARLAERSLGRVGVLR
jgi:hypothetical protein